MYIYVYVHIYINICIYIYIYMYLYVYIYVYMYIYVCMCMYISIYTIMSAMYVHICMYIYTCIYTYMYIFIHLHYDDCKYKLHVQYCQDPEHIYTCIYIYIYICIYIYIYTMMTVSTNRMCNTAKIPSETAYSTNYRALLRKMTYEDKAPMTLHHPVSHVQYCQDPERNGKLNPLDYLPSETPTELNRMPLAQ